MKPILMLVIFLAVFSVLVGGCTVISGVSAYNSEVRLRKAIVAQSEVNEASLDTMWKIIKQKANISEKAVAEIKDLNKTYEELVAGRSGGALFKMVTENHPDLGQAEVSKLYMSVMASVEAERNVFKRDQTKLVDLVRERSALIDGFFNKWLIPMFGGNTMKFCRRGYAATPEGYPSEFQYIFVTSKATKIMTETGEENDIELFE